MLNNYYLFPQSKDGQMNLLIKEITLSQSKRPLCINVTVYLGKWMR